MQNNEVRGGQLHKESHEFEITNSETPTEENDPRKDSMAELVESAEDQAEEAPQKENIVDIIEEMSRQEKVEEVAEETLHRGKIVEITEETSQEKKVGPFGDRAIEERTNASGESSKNELNNNNNKINVQYIEQEAPSTIKIQSFSMIKSITLENGVKHDSVIVLKRNLASLAFPVPGNTTDHFGKKNTEQKVKEFQQYYGVNDRLGVAGEVTLARIEEILSSPYQNGKYDAGTKTLKKNLERLGYPVSSKPTTHYGPVTEATRTQFSSEIWFESEWYRGFDYME